MGHWYVRAFFCVACVDGVTSVGKDRRESGEFIGAEGVRKHLKEGPPRRRVGLTVEGAPARRECYVPHILCVFPNHVSQRERRSSRRPAKSKSVRPHV